MPSLAIKPSVSFDQSVAVPVLDSDRAVGGLRRGELDGNKLRVYSISFENMTESEAQTIVDLFETVNYTQPFDYTVADPEIESGAYCITPNSFSVNILTGNHYNLTFQIEFQYPL